MPPDDEIGDKHDYQAIIELEWIAFLMRLFRRTEKSAAYPLAPDVMRKRRAPRNKGPPVNQSPRR